MPFALNNCKPIMVIVSLLSAYWLSSEQVHIQLNFIGIASEGSRGSYDGSISNSFMDDRRMDFQSDLTDLLGQKSANSKILNIYQQTFGRNRDEINIPECLKQIDSRDVLPRIHLDYEAHHETNAEAYLATNARLAQEGKAMLLVESDFPTQGSSDFERPIHGKGLLRSQAKMGIRSLPQERRFLISGIDHPALRAAGILLSVAQDLWNSRQSKDVDENFRKMLTEIFRNSSLRLVFNQLIANSKPPTKVANLFKSYLQNLDYNPTWNTDNLSLLETDHEQFVKFTKDLTHHFNRQFPHLKSVGYTVQFDLRDEHMSQKILEKICLARKWNIPAIHVSIGALHVDGIGTRLQKVSKQLGLTLNVYEKNAMLPSDPGKPFAKVFDEGVAFDKKYARIRNLFEEMRLSGELDQMLKRKGKK